VHRRVSWPIWVIPAAVLVSGCAPQAPPPSRNVLLVSIDTLRADRVAAGIAPALDRFAAAGVQFANARTPVPLTLPAHASLLTGALPAAHGVHVNGQVLPSDVPTLATVLREAGYRTGGFVGAYVLDRRFGLARGFDAYDDRVPRDPQASDRLEAERPADQVVDAALAWLDADPRTPFFLWVHLYDPHAPYAAPAGAPGVPGRNPYDAEVAYAGAQAGRLFERLDARGLTDSTVIVLAGDHGEGLGEHGEQTHGMLAYDATLRVPLVVAAPGETARRIAAPVSLADVAPSVLKLAGVTGTLVAGASTRDLFAAADEGEVYAETEYPAAAGWSPLSVLANARWKLIRASTPELYDLRADPVEAINLAASNRREVQEMAGRLGAARGSERLRAGAAAPDAEARLRALGYVGGAPPTAASAAAPNPAAEIVAWGRFEQALSALARGDHAVALPIARDLAASFPAGPVFQSTYARALLDAGQAAAAVTVLRSAVERRPDDPSLFHDLSVAARATGDAAEALRAEQAALALDGSNPQALNGVGLLHVEAGRSREAVAAFEQATAADPSNATYWSNLGNARRALGEASAAEASYRRALDVQPAHADAANGLGVLLVQRGDAAQAVAWFERALGAAPDFYEARLNLGIAYQESGQRAQAVAAYQQVLREAPRQATRERAAATELLRGLR